MNKDDLDRIKQHYLWVPWFKELAAKIADGGEQYLIDRAKKVNWVKQSPALLEYGDEGIDPFSFFYFLASKNTTKQFKPVYSSVGEIFELIETDISRITEDSIFPTSSFNHLFHGGREFSPNILWILFRQAASTNKTIDSDNFKNALKIENVGVPKLSQALFLINPDRFHPIDQWAAEKFGEGDVNTWKNKIRNEGYPAYENAMAEINSSFPNCKPYEINFFSYMQGQDELINHESQFFQISSNVFDNQANVWENSYDKEGTPSFRDGSCVYIGAHFSSTEKKNPYKQLSAPKRGDIIFVRDGTSKGQGIGVVFENEYVAESDPPYGWHKNKAIRVIWINKSHSIFSEHKTSQYGFSPIKQNQKTYKAFEKAYSSTFKMINRLMAEPAVNGDIKSTIHSLNTILYGPPGTGKTWLTVNLSLAIVLAKEIDDVNEEDREKFNAYLFNIRDGSGQIAFTTFHQNYAYEDFVEGIRPTVEGGEVGYEIRDGIFKNLASAAKKNPNQSYVLIIDEINRGNVAKIFGELITLIEDTKRLGEPDEKEVILPYSQDSFGVPSNLYIIGTMNTADRSIQILDTALRRRFMFLEMMPETSHEKIPTDINGINCQKILESMNRRIFSLLDRERQIGHTYFFGITTIEKLADAFQNRIIPLLQEYFFDDWSKIRVVLGHNKFVQERTFDDQSLSEYRDSENKYFERLSIEDEGWTSPENYTQIYQNR